MKKIDILFYLYGMDGGGAERHVLYLLQRLDRERFSPRLFLECADGPYMERIPPDVPVEFLYRSFRDRRGRLPYWKEMKLVHALGRYLKKQPPDLIYARMYSSAVVAGLATLWSGLDAPVVASEAIFPSVGIVPDMGGYSPLRLHLVKRIQRDVSRVIVCPARRMVEDAVAFYGCPREKTRVIPNGVDIELLDRMKADPSPHPWAGDGDPLVLGIGRLCPQKGFDVLLEAFSRVAGEVPRARLLILGKGEDRDRLLARASAMGLAKRVDLPGWLPNPYSILHRSTVYVLSSRFEGFPNVVLEAMACGIPVVSTDCPSGPEEILEGGAGDLVPVCDAGAMARSIQRLLLDARLREERVREGRRRVEERYSLEGMVSAYSRLFEEVGGALTAGGFPAERKIPEMSSSSSV